MLLQGTANADTLTGYTTDDMGNGNGGNDILYGGAGNDTLNGNDGSDTVNGEIGDDTLNGGADSDTYRFGRGSGQDTITDYDTGTGKTGVIEFAADIAPSDIQLSRSGDHLVLAVNGTADKLTVTSYLSNDGISGYQLEQIKFADGTLWDLATVKPILLQGTANADNLTGYRYRRYGQWQRRQ